MRKKTEKDDMGDDEDYLQRGMVLKLTDSKNVVKCYQLHATFRKLHNKWIIELLKSKGQEITLTCFISGL